MMLQIMNIVEPELFWAAFFDNFSIVIKLQNKTPRNPVLQYHKIKCLLSISNT